MSDKTVLDSDPLIEAVRRRGILDAATLDRCLEVQAGASAAGRPVPPLAQILLREGLVTASLLADLLVEIQSQADGLAQTVPLRSGVGSPLQGLSALGRYQLIREIAQGGMGAIYQAVDPDLNRLVALKVLKDAGGEGSTVARLQREARLAGRLSHPNIITIHEVGTAPDPQTGNEIHFIAMDFIDGRTLDELLPELTRDVRLRILEQVAEAVGHAHEHGVVHRDLKPHNIMLTRNQIPVVTDFGLARSEGDTTRLTRTHAVMGTTPYMSPEQVLGLVDDIDSRSDVWSLGVMLYESLTLVRPFLGETPQQVYDQILNHEPLPPRRQVADIERDLETICLKALEKDPDRRYVMAGMLAADLRRWRFGEPILAHPPTQLYLLMKWARRHTGALIAAGTVLVIAIAATAVAFSNIREQRNLARAAEARERFGREATQAALARAEADRASADEARQQAESIGRRNEANLLSMRAQAAVELGRHAEALVYAAAARDGADTPLSRVLQYQLRHLPLRLSWTLRLPPKTDVLAGAGDGVLTIGAQRRGLQLIDSLSGEARLTLIGWTSRPRFGAVAADGAFGATLSAEGELCTWDLRSAALRRRVPGSGTGQITHVAWSADASRAAVARHGDPEVRIWDVKAGKVIHELPTEAASVRALAIAPDGGRVVVASQRLLTSWNREGQLLDKSPMRDVSALAFSRDGRRVLVGSSRGAMTLWDSVLDKRVSLMRAELPNLERRVAAGAINVVCFSPDEQLCFAASSRSHVLHYWDVRTGRRLGQLRLWGLYQVRLLRTAEGAAVVSVLGNGRVLIRGWQILAGEPERVLWPSRQQNSFGDVYTRSAISADGRLLAVASDAGVRIRDAATAEERATLVGHSGQLRFLRFAPTGTRILTGGDDRVARLWDATTGKQLMTFPDHRGEVAAGAFMAGGSRIVTASRDRNARLWDTHSGHLKAVLAHGREAVAVDCSPDGEWIAVGGSDGVTKVWAADSGRLARTWTDDPSPVVGIAFSPDSATLLIAGLHGRVRLWDVASGALVRVISHTSRAVSARFASEGRMVVLADNLGHITCWDAQSGLLLATLAGHTRRLNSIDVSGDGRLLASAGADGAIRLWGLEVPASLAEAQRVAGLRLDGINLVPIERRSFGALRRRFPTPGLPAWPRGR